VTIYTYVWSIQPYRGVSVCPAEGTLGLRMGAHLAHLPQTCDAGRSFFSPNRNKPLYKILSGQRDKNQGGLTKMVFESAVYLPEDLSLLGKVLDQVVQSLPPNLRTPYNQVEIARNILACAATGERDPDVLRRAALMDSKVAAAA